jgi:hypothetical protein
MLRELKGPQIEDVPHADVIGPPVCFEVEHVDDLANWRSVIA